MAKKAFLLVDENPSNLDLLRKARQSEEKDSDTTFIWWTGWRNGNGEISLPRYLALRLVEIRSEHATWAFEEGERNIDGTKLAEQLTLDGTLSLWWLSLLYERHPKMTPNLYTIYRLRALEYCLDEMNISDLTLVGGDPVLSSVLQSFCGQTRRAFHAIEEKKEEKSGSAIKKIYDMLPHALRAGLRFIVWLLTVRIPAGKAKLSCGEKKTATIATYFPNIDDSLAKEGRFRSRYFEDLHTLLARGREKTEIRWLFIRFPSPKYSFRDCCALRDRFQKKAEDGYSFTFLEECISWQTIRSAFSTFFRLRKKAAALESRIVPHAYLPGSHMPFFPYIRDDYRESFEGWRALERILQYEGIKNFMRAVGPQRFTLFPLENCPWERMLTSAVRAVGEGMIIGAQHSSIRPTDFRYFDDPRIFEKPEIPTPDRIVANGTSAYEQWKNAGVPPSRLRMAEALRYQYLAGSQRKKSQGKPECVLIATSFFRDETAAHMDLFLQAVRSGVFSGYTCILKPHPYLALDEFLPNPLPPGIVLGDKPTASYFSDNVLVWTSNSTTLALEAAVLGLPLAVMQPSRDFDLCPIQDIPDLMRTGTVEDVRAMLAEPRSVAIPDNYLLLTPGLPAWKACLAETGFAV